MLKNRVKIRTEKWVVHKDQSTQSLHGFEGGVSSYDRKQYIEIISECNICEIRVRNGKLCYMTILCYILQNRGNDSKKH